MVTKTLLEDLLGEDGGPPKNNDGDDLLAPLLEEMDQIDDLPLRNFVRTVLLFSPHFFSAPVSTRVDAETLFPPDECVPGGLVLHTKRVTRTARLLCEAQGRTRGEIDIVLTAALIHDVTRIIELGDAPEAIQMEDPYHSITIDKYLEVIDLSRTEGHEFIDRETLSAITRLIHTHLGQWSPIPEVIPVTSLEWIMHFADYVCSNIHFILDGVDQKPSRWQ